MSAFGPSSGPLRTALALGAVTATEQALVTNTMGLVHLPGPAEPFVSHNSLPLLVLGAVAGVLLLVWVLRSRLAERQRERHRGRSPFGPEGGSRLIFGLATLSSLSTLTTASLIVLIAIHSPLLPNTALPSPAGPHDQNLEVQLTAVQASDYLIPGDPSSYSLANLPNTTGASGTVVEKPIKSAASAPSLDPYRVVLSIHNLHTSGPGIFIESVSLRILAVDQSPSTIRVWDKPSRLNYAVNPFAVVYDGEPAGRSVLASYAGPVPQGHVQLSSQETDELTIDIGSAVDDSIRFQVEVGYRLSDQRAVHTFVLPVSFKVTFVEDTAWVTYSFTGGHFFPD